MAKTPDEKDWDAKVAKLPHSARKQYRTEIAFGAPRDIAYRRAAEEAKDRLEEEEADDLVADQKPAPILPVSYWDAKNILLPEAYESRVRAAEKLGRMDELPDPLLPLDKFVEGLRQGHHAKVKMREEARARGRAALMFEARSRVCLAVAAAELAADAEDRLVKQRTRWSQAMSSVQKIKSALEEALDTFGPNAIDPPGPSGAGRPDYAEDNRQRAQVLAWRDDFQRAYQAAEASEQFLEARLAANKPRRKAGPGSASESQSVYNAWAAGFVDALGFLWREWTGKFDVVLPAALVELVEVAYAAVAAPSNRKFAWENQVRNGRRMALKRPEWDDYRRYEKDSHPPGMQFETPEHREARQAARAERDREAKEWIEAKLVALRAIPPTSRTEQHKAAEDLLNNPGALDFVLDLIFSENPKDRAEWEARFAV